MKGDGGSAQRRCDRPVVEMRGIVKRYPGVLANDHVDFSACPGEVHGLLGENGAGKTTLMNILYGTIKPDEGEIILWGEPVSKWHPTRALRRGVVMVAQHFRLIPRLTVLENIMLGVRGAGKRMKRRDVLQKLEEVSTEYGLAVNPYDYVWQLSAGEKQRVELARALVLDAKLLILDEPTSVLTPPEVEGLFKVLRAIARKGRTVIFITHKLWEAMEVCDRITVLRRGRNVGTVDRGEATPELLTRMMFGEAVSAVSTVTSARARRLRRKVLVVRDLWVKSDRGHWAVKGASFDVYAGEILGIAGVAGNGQRELVEAIVGLRRKARGSVHLNGIDVTELSARELINLGVAYVPEERVGVGVAPGLSVAENAVTKSYWRRPFSRRLVMDWKAVYEYARKLVRKYGVLSPSLTAPVETLSGGNIQRLILARELSLAPRLLVAHNPTSGLDVKAAASIRGEIVGLAGKGAAVLLVSEELEEVLMLSDRIAVMYDGELHGPFEKDEVTREEIGYLMVSGAKRSKPVAAAAVEGGRKSAGWSAS